MGQGRESIAIDIGLHPVVHSTLHILEFLAKRVVGVGIVVGKPQQSPCLGLV